MPHAALFGAAEVDLQKAASNNAQLRPIQAGGWGPRFNIDGVISVASNGPGKPSTGYVQLFRSGIIEVVFSEVFFQPSADIMPGVLPGVGAGEVSTELRGVLERTRELLRILEVAPPFSLFVSLHGMKEVRLHVSRRLGYENFAFDRDDILLPEALLPTFDEPSHHALRPILDALWQAAGLERCFEYTDDGEWSPSR